MKNHIFILLFLLCMSANSIGQTSDKLSKTTLIDEFGRISDCDRGARLDAMMIEVMNNPGSKAYIFIFGGTKDVLKYQSVRYIKKWETILRNYMNFRGYDLNKFVIKYAGFKDQDSLSTRIWIKPENGEIPKPLYVVPRPKKPTKRAFLADKSWFNFDDASFETINNLIEDSTFIEAYQNDGDGLLEEEDEEFQRLIEREKYFVSDYFLSELAENKKSKGIIFYYFDEEEYHLGNAQEILTKNLNEFSEKYKVKTKNIRIIYGGYREKPDLEFWIVPHDAPDALAKPEKKIIE